MVGDLFFDGRVVALVCLEIRPQQPCPERVVWPRPALGMIVFIPDRIEVVALTWWGRVERFSAAQVNTGDQDVDVDSAIVLAVQDGGQVYVLPVQSGKSQLLEVVQHGVDFILCRCLFGSPRDNGAGIPLLERQRVGQGTEQHRVSPQHLNACPSNPLVV